MEISLQDKSHLVLVRGFSCENIKCESMKTYKLIWIVSFLTITTTLMACKKYLEVIPDKSLTLASSLDDLQAILDSYSEVSSSSPLSLMMGSDEYFMDDAAFGSNSASENMLYLWQKVDSRSDEWQVTYKTIATANIILEELQRQPDLAKDIKRSNNIKGSAYFLRGYLFYLLQEIYGQPYQEGTATAKMSIPLRISSDVNVPSKKKYC